MAGVSRFDCFPSDFLNGTVGMTADQIAVYTVVLMLQYDRGEHVIYIGREREVAMRSGMTKKRLERAVGELIELGKLHTDGGTIFNRRADKEIEKIRDKIEKNRENSEKGGNATRDKYYRRPLENNASTGPTGHPSGQPSPSPIPRPPSPNSTPLPSVGPQGGSPRSRSSGCALPDDWMPPEELFVYGSDNGLDRTQTAEILENMRLWAQANRNRPIARKADWIATMKGAIRRDAVKVRARVGPRTDPATVGSLLAQIYRDEANDKAQTESDFGNVLSLPVYAPDGRAVGDDVGEIYRDGGDLLGRHGR